MKTRIFKTILAVTFITGFTSRAFSEDIMNRAEVKAKEMMYSIVDKSNYVISFPKGSSMLDQGTKNSLKALFQSLDKELTTGEVVISTWSDKEFPLNSSTKLSKADVDLARSRAESISNFVRTIKKDATLITMNMAEQNSLLTRLFASDEAQVKQAIQTGDTDSRKVASIVKVLKDKGGPGKGIVLVRKPLEIPNS